VRRNALDRGRRALRPWRFASRCAGRRRIPTKLWTEASDAEARWWSARSTISAWPCAASTASSPGRAHLQLLAHVGARRALRGFVAGRELREGCVIPSLGGGLCQLSNALYDAALKAGVEIVERHAHSQVIPASLAEVGATPRCSGTTSISASRHPRLSHRGR